MSDQNEWPMGTWDAPLWREGGDLMPGETWRLVPGCKRASRMECLKLALSLRNISFLTRRIALKQFITG
jgi:hypothetical protein